VVHCRLRADTCSLNPRRVMKAQHGKKIHWIRYFTWSEPLQVCWHVIVTQ